MSRTPPQTPELFLGLLSQIRAPRPGDVILDLGCGDGSMVEALRRHGLDTFGCDLSTSLRTADDPHHVRAIETDPYRLPFPPATFDFVISSQVFEHVMNMAETFAEIRRVLKPDGIGLQVFTCRRCVLEPHTFVPLATVLRTRWWLLLWAALGVRNELQRGMSARQVASQNFVYLRDHTNYPPTRIILALARRHFAVAGFRDDLFVEVGSSPRATLARRISRLSSLTRTAIIEYYRARRGDTRALVLRP